MVRYDEGQNRWLIEEGYPNIFQHFDQTNDNILKN
jgi:hypothetical protein